MDFLLSEEQELLQSSIASYLRQNCTHDKRLAALKQGGGGLPGMWQEWAELGWLGLPFTQDDGGLGMGPIELMLLGEELGRHLAQEPYLETVMLSGGLIAALGTAEQKAQYLPALIAGELHAAFAWLEHPHRHWDQPQASLERRDGVLYLNGSKAVVYNAPKAGVLVVLATNKEHGLSLVLVPGDTAGVSRRDYPTLDGRQASEVQFKDVLLPESALLGTPGQAFTAVEKILDLVRLMTAAEALGAMQALLEATVEYTKQRKQFGVAISQFQVLQHKMADMFMAIELTRSLLYAAAIKLHEGAPDAALFATAAKAKADAAARSVVHEAIQLHGAIATTHELPIGHYLKRLTVLAQMFGTPRQQLQRFAQQKAAILEAAA